MGLPGGDNVAGAVCGHSATVSGLTARL